MTGLASAIYDSDLVLAWKAACDLVANQKSVGYVLVVSFGNAWQGSNEQRQALDKAAREVKADSPSSVASMLLPKSVRMSKQSAAEAIESGQIMMGRGRSRGLKYSGWSHTYFERLTGSWIDKNGDRESISQNKLLKAIEKIVEWDKNYEAAFYIHTNLLTESFKPLGSPCLQYVQLRLYGDKLLSIVGLYRAHDYVEKALGNFIGLNDLGHFIADKTGRTFTGCDVVSLHPFVERKSQANAYLAAV
ncbi:hypothetical protein [Aquisediminimonas profunda]|uniref:hypothetical protein n=1 Tax=Aquisediminimonas profunda TaxID=1550733 RepID=UPI001C6361EA|nr:hypothetical protein [Aquisediminimonas profunda]